MIMIVYGYTISRKISIENSDRTECVYHSLCENPRLSSPKESITDLSIFIVILDVMVVLQFSTHTLLIGDSYDVPG